MPPEGPERWADVPLDEIDLPSFLGRPAMSSEDRLAAVMDGARAVREERDRRRAEELAAIEKAGRRTRRRRRARRVLVGTVVVVAVLAAGFALRENPTVRASLDELAAGQPDDVATSEAPLDTDDAGGVGPSTTDPSTTAVVPPTTATPIPRRPPPGNRPSPQVATSSTPLGVPLEVSGDGPHAFVGMGADGEPVAYDPCRTIPVVVNNRTAPPNGDELVDSALAEVSRVTGLQFVREGPSDEVAAADRIPYQPDRYGDRWAPVLIAWSDPTVNPELESTILGQGGSTWLETEGRSVYVTGSVVLDGPELDLMASGWNGYAAVRSVLMHELGHVVGLDHVEDPSQLMYADTTGVTEFAAGDLAGLAELGRGPCTDVL